MNRLLAESKDVQWPVGLPGWCDKVRLQPTIEAILDSARPAMVGKGDQLVLGALKAVLIERIVAGDLRAVYDTVEALIGPNTPGGASGPNREVGTRKPLAKA